LNNNPEQAKWKCASLPEAEYAVPVPEHLLLHCMVNTTTSVQQEKTISGVRQENETWY
jgi:hypothetical protein